MKNVTRLDLMSIEKSDMALSNEGFLSAEIYATRTGVFNYQMSDGSILRELRPPEEVFDSESMNSLKSKPMTLKHPQDFVNSSNAMDLSVGFTGESVTVKDKQFLAVPTTIIDGKTIDSIKSGMVEVSCGYTADMEYTSGVFQGQEYDAIQRNIRYNHVAVVDLGRAGPEARFRLDSATAVIMNDNKNIKIDFHTEETMEKITLNGSEFEVSADLKTAINSSLEAKKVDSKALETLTTKNEELTAKVDSANEVETTLKAEIAELKKKADSINVSELVKERKSLEEVATKLVSKDELEESLKLDNLDLKKKVISCVSEADLSEKSEIYVSARFDSVVENIELHVSNSKEEIEAKDKKEDKKEDKAELSPREKAKLEAREQYKA